MRKALICVLALAAVGGGAYYLGTKSNATPPAGSETTETAKGPIIEDGLIVPTGLKVPENAPPIKVDQPAKVLAGEVKIPNDLLRTEPPPPHPALIIPSIPTDKK